MSTLGFYEDQAKIQTEAAAQAKLPEVRARCLRAADAWAALAHRAQKLDTARALKAGQDRERLLEKAI